MDVSRLLMISVDPAKGLFFSFDNMMGPSSL